MEIKVLKNLPAGWKGRKIKSKNFPEVIYEAYFVPKKAEKIAKEKAKERGLSSAETKKLINNYKDYYKEFRIVKLYQDKINNVIDIEIEDPQNHTKYLRAKTPSEANKIVLNFMRKLSKRKTYQPLDIKKVKRLQREVRM